MRLSILLLLLAAVVGSPLQAGAAELKVGVVNLQKILQESPQVQQVKVRLKKEFAPQQQELLDKQQALEDLEQKLARSGATMNTSDRESMQMKVATLQHDIQQLRNDFLDDLNLRRNQELSKLQRLVLDEVNSYADENGFDLIIGDGVFYASQRVNITDDIIERLNQDFNNTGDKAKPAAASD
ncbi:MAG TPA: OmpH family outer membrane protein [Gammaproteobacteria bacterium]|nr:OmpH family outer membrane protein [Gammaproteobacteria bacterium]